MWGGGCWSCRDARARNCERHCALDTAEHTRRTHTHGPERARRQTRERRTHTVSWVHTRDGPVTHHTRRTSETHSAKAASSAPFGHISTCSGERETQRTSYGMAHPRHKGKTHGVNGRAHPKLMGRTAYGVLMSFLSSRRYSRSREIEMHGQHTSRPVAVLQQHCVVLETHVHRRAAYAAR